MERDEIVDTVCVFALETVELILEAKVAAFDSVETAETADTADIEDSEESTALLFARTGSFDSCQSRLYVVRIFRATSLVSKFRRLYSSCL